MVCKAYGSNSLDYRKGIAIIAWIVIFTILVLSSEIKRTNSDFGFSLPLIEDIDRDGILSYIDGRMISMGLIGVFSFNEGCYRCSWSKKKISLHFLSLFPERRMRSICAILD